MNDLRAAAQQALEAWDQPHGINYVDFRPYMDALRSALSEPVQERNFCPRCGKRTNDIHTCTPPQAEPEGDALTAAYMLGRYDGKRKPLTTEEVEQLWAQSSWQGRANIGFARAIEKAHGIGV